MKSFKLISRPFALRYRAYWLLVLIFILAAAWLWPVGWVDDDRAYTHMIMPTDRWSYYMECRGPRLETVGDALLSAVRHWQYTNGRLSDKVLMLVQLPPLGAHGANVFCAAVITLMMWLLCCAAGLRRSSGALMLTAVLCWWWLPWSSLFTQRAYLLNYIMPSSLMLGLMWTLQLPAPWSRRRTAAAMLLGFSGAWTHEIFGGAILTYLCVFTGCTWLNSRRSVPKHLWLCIAAAVAGLALNLASPGNLLRAAEEPLKFDWHTLYLHLTRLVVPMLPVALALVLAVATALKRPWVKSPDLWATLVAMLAATGVCVLYISAGRFAWCALILAIYLCLRCFDIIFPRLYSSLSGGLCVLSCAYLYTLWGLQLAEAQQRRSDAEQRMFESLAAGHGPVVEYEALPPNSLPWYTGAIVQAPQGVSHFFAWFDGTSYGYERCVIYAPKGYADKPLDQWPRVPGHSEVYGADGIYYVPANRAGSVYMVTFGEETLAASPVEMLYNRVRGPRPMPDSLLAPGQRPIPGTYAEFTQHWTYPVGDINGQPVCGLYLGDFRRGLTARRILRIDSIPRQ